MAPGRREPKGPVAAHGPHPGAHGRAGRHHLVARVAGTHRHHLVRPRGPGAARVPRRPGARGGRGHRAQQLVHGCAGERLPARRALGRLPAHARRHHHDGGHQPLRAAAQGPPAALRRREGRLLPADAGAGPQAPGAGQALDEGAGRRGLDPVHRQRRPAPGRDQERVRRRERHGDRSAQLVPAPQPQHQRDGLRRRPARLDGPSCALLRAELHQVGEDGHHRHEPRAVQAPDLRLGRGHGARPRRERSVSADRSAARVGAFTMLTKNGIFRAGVAGAIVWRYFTVLNMDEKDAFKQIDKGLKIDEDNQREMRMLLKAQKRLEFAEEDKSLYSLKTLEPRL
ncbi:hypothetical protein ON010_g7663 [Phytophthora cinnamomi]|nr:hypothetical protein ON010_g7663 [Phytophthora cinnamomi]